MRFLLPVLLAFTCSCTISGAKETDEKIGAAIRKLETTLSTCRKRFQEDDVRIGNLLRTKVVSPLKTKKVETFVRDRSGILDRMKTLLTELRGIRKFFHQDAAGRNEAELIAETEKRIDGWKQKNRRLSEELERIRLRHQEIRRQLKAAPIR